MKQGTNQKTETSRLGLSESVNVQLCTIMVQDSPLHMAPAFEESDVFVEMQSVNSVYVYTQDSSRSICKHSKR